VGAGADRRPLCGARGGGDRSWLLIKHRDDWAGDVDIIEFAPLSVKSGGDFEDILGEDAPAVWQSNRPAKGGDAGAMLAKIIERAAKLKTRAARAQRTQRRRRTQRLQRNHDTKERAHERHEAHGSPQEQARNRRKK
jgi:hypothetical protein